MSLLGKATFSSRCHLEKSDCELSSAIGEEVLISHLGTNKDINLSTAHTRVRAFATTHPKRSMPSAACLPGNRIKRLSLRPPSLGSEHARNGRKKRPLKRTFSAEPISLHRRFAFAICNENMV